MKHHESIVITVLAAVLTGALLLSSHPVRSHQGQQARPAAPAEGGQALAEGSRVVVSTDLALDQEKDIQVHVWCVLSPLLLDVGTEQMSRVVTVFYYSTIADVIQTDLSVQAPVVVATGTATIENHGGIVLDGAPREYTVSVAPRDGLSWSGVASLEDLSVEATLADGQ